MPRVPGSVNNCIKKLSYQFNLVPEMRVTLLKFLRRFFGLSPNSYLKTALHLARKALRVHPLLHEYGCKFYKAKLLHPFLTLVMLNKIKMPRPLLISSQSDYLIRFFDRNSTYSMTNNADPAQLASPTDLDLHCFLRQGMSCSAREGLTIYSEEPGKCRTAYVFRFCVISSKVTGTCINR